RNAINANSGTAIAMPVILVAMQAAANMEHSNASRGRSVSSHRAHQYAAQAAVQSTSGSWVTPLLRWVNIGVAPTKMALANAASLLPVVWRTNIPSPSSARAPISAVTSLVLRTRASNPAPACAAAAAAGVARM